MAASSCSCPPSPTGLPPFQFRPRHESPDWRRLSAVDVSRVSAEVDVAVLQEHLGHVAFCTAERERCPHCQAPADPLLLKLLRLAQLCLEYLLHSQDYLSAQLRAQRELLRSASVNRDQLAKEVARSAQEIRLLKEECKRRKKMISTQQMMLQAGTTCHQCQFCDKAFMNYSFLRSHLQRRHAEDPLTDQKRKAQTDKLQEEINTLKEQLQLTRSQLESQQNAHIVKLIKGYEEHKSKEEELRQLFLKWKEEEKEKLANELEKVKEMFMKEFKELTMKNTELENHLIEVQKSSNYLKSNLGTLKDSYECMEEKSHKILDHQNIMDLLEKQESRWTSKVHALQEEHEKEKNQLRSQIDKLKTSMTEDLNASNTFYKKRIEELGQRLQEQNELIIAQKHQIQKLATKKSVESMKSPDLKSSSQVIVQPKSSVPSTREQPLSVHMLESIEELPEDEKETEKQEVKEGKSKQHIINTLKSNSSLTRELRTVLEQTLAEKLESLGIKSGVHGIPSDHFSRVLLSVESAREEKKRQIPDIQHIREQLERQVSFRVAERASCSRLLSSPHLSLEAKEKAVRIGGSLSTVLPKPAKRPSVAKCRSTEQTVAAEKKPSTPKIKKSTLGDKLPKKPHSITTSPFSSEEETDDDIMQSYISPELSQRKTSEGSTRGNLSRYANQSDMSSPEENEVEEIKTTPKCSKSILVQRGAGQVEKSPLDKGKENKISGRIDIGSPSVEKCAQEVKFMGDDEEEEEEEEWDLSSLEDENPFPIKEEKCKSATNIEKHHTNAASTVHAWGAPLGKAEKEEGQQDPDTSTLKSSLVSVTDWSDFSDM